MAFLGFSFVPLSLSLSEDGEVGATAMAGGKMFNFMILLPNNITSMDYVMISCVITFDPAQSISSAYVYWCISEFYSFYGSFQSSIVSALTGIFRF